MLGWLAEEDLPRWEPLRPLLAEQAPGKLAPNEGLLLTLRVDRPLDWVDLARLFEPEEEVSPERRRLALEEARGLSAGAGFGRRPLETRRDWGSNKKYPLRDNACMPYIGLPRQTPLH